MHLKRFSVRIWTLIAVLFFAAACGSTSFSGSSGNKGKDSDGKSGKNGDSSADNGKGKNGGKGDGDTGLANSTDSASDSANGGPGSASDSGNSTEVLSDGSIRQTFRGESTKLSRSVDVVFAMDTSGSMSDEKASLQTNMAQFITKFETDAKTVDYRIYMIGENFVFPGGGDKIVKIQQPVNSHDALIVMQNFITGTIPSPMPLRSDSLKQIVVVTDDESEVTSATFKTFIQSTAILQGKTKFNGFVGLPTSVESATCSLAGIGQQYITLGSDPEVGGLIQDICIADWSKLLKDLASSIITDVTRGSFKLDYPADVGSELVVKVNGSTVSPDVASYDAVLQSVIFKKGSEPPVGAEVMINYTRK